MGYLYLLLLVDPAASLGRCVGSERVDDVINMAVDGGARDLPGSACVADAASSLH